MLRPVGAYVLEPEAPREVEIKLYGGELPGTADGVHQLHVDFGSVEDSLAGHVLEGDLHAAERIHQRAFGPFPLFDRAGVMLAVGGITGGKLHLVMVEPEGLEHSKGELHAGLNFIFELLRPAKDVSV